MMNDSTSRRYWIRTTTEYDDAIRDAKRRSGDRGRELLDDLIRSDCVAAQWDAIGSDRYLIDPERAERCDAAAADGCDGSTHGERIDDWRAAAADLNYLDDDDIADGRTSAIDGDGLTDDDAARLWAAIDAVELRHAAADTLDDAIG